MKTTAFLTCLLFIVSIPTYSEINSASDQAGNPYARWKNGPPSNPSYFPIAVWLQNPNNASRYKAAGINLYVGLWRGPTDEQLATLASAGMQVICSQNRTGLAHKDDPTIVGWMHGDEPDNAQAVVNRETGERSYGPPVPPTKIVADYRRISETDPTRPVMLNLGQGVANDEWVGRGSQARRDDYLTYVEGCDILSFDVYPVVGLRKPDSENYLWYVPKGVDRLIRWSGNRKIVWNCIECTRISSEEKKATPDQVRAEIWMSIIHGSMGLIYFVHEWQRKFNEHALLDDPEMLSAVTAINRQIHELAPVVNSPTLPNGAAVISSRKEIPVDIMVKRHEEKTYLFAVSMRNGPTSASFKVYDLPPTATAEVLGENRRITVRDGLFEDQFDPYAVHLYAIE